MKPSRTKAYLLAVVGLFILWHFSGYMLSGFDYSIVSKGASPSGHLTLYEVESLSEGGHAPYGQHLVLSSGSVRKPDDGYVVFAGYCYQPLSYSWKSDEHISVTCKVKDKIDTRTKAEIVQGIKVEVVYDK